MKFQYYLTLIFIIFSLSTAKGSENKSAAKIILLRGSGFKLTAGKTEQEKLKLHQNLFWGDSIKTSKQSLVRIKFKNGTIFNVGPNSFLRIQESKKPTKQDVQTRNTYQFFLGKLRAKFQSNKNTKHIIDTRLVSMAVRGTEVLINALKQTNGNHITQMALLSGKADLLDKASSKKYTLKPGKQLVSMVDAKNSAYGMKFINIQPNIYKRMIAQSKLLYPSPTKAVDPTDGQLMLADEAPDQKSKKSPAVKIDEDLFLDYYQKDDLKLDKRIK